MRINNLWWWRCKLSMVASKGCGGGEKVWIWLCRVRMVVVW